MFKNLSSGATVMRLVNKICSCSAPGKHLTISDEDQIVSCLNRVSVFQLISCGSEFPKCNAAPSNVTDNTAEIPMPY